MGILLAKCIRKAPTNDWEDKLYFIAGIEKTPMIKTLKQERKMGQM